jgi:hypothetical protein
LTNYVRQPANETGRVANAGLSGGSPTAATKLERAIEASSSPGSPTPTVPGIFGTLDEVAATQPGPRLANTIEQAGADLHQGRGVVAPKVAPDSAAERADDHRRASDVDAQPSDQGSV